MKTRKLLTLSAAALLAAAPLTVLATAAEADPVAGLAPVADSDFHDDGRPDQAKVRLGRFLFFDKVLSGNRNIACATCHHPTLAAADGVSLSLGEGARGLGTERREDPGTPLLGRVPRNAPALHFLGAREFIALTHDGRVEVDPARTWPSGFWTPAREQLPEGLDNALAAQALFPVLSNIEMAGHKGENAVADAVALNRLGGQDGAWAILARRLQKIPEYVDLFVEAFPEVDQSEDITIVQAANAIAAFQTTAFRPDDSPFDRYLRSRDPAVLSPAARRGMALFYGDAGCAACHSGKFQTDHRFHAIAMPQIGPGKSDGWDRSYWRATGYAARVEDFGRYRVTFRPEDRYRFRTPSLRNVELTGPWGHAGSYASLEAVVRHHLDPVAALERYDAREGALPRLQRVIEPRATGSRLSHEAVNPARLADYLRRDTWAQETGALRRELAEANELPPRSLSDAQVEDLLAFLRALTDPRSRDLSALVPRRVPSGLPVAD
ncbi:cytochrome-c peroxidase [Pelagibius sp.]|uniref:cytochrome-c peroxidase n=1 Tax=Pelagibius sp. TaxID=1931238 RepID=UPI0026193B08|nr:cytochrome c peroxidase [Pelagibius sp.]